MTGSVLASATEGELAYIAALNYGLEERLHRDALRAVLHDQGGQVRAGQLWYPYEVVELCAHALVPGHEREFAICTLLVIAAVKSGSDTTTDLAGKFKALVGSYDALPSALREEILDAYATTEC